MDQSNTLIELRQKIEQIKEELLITRLSIINLVMENESNNNEN